MLGGGFVARPSRQGELQALQQAFDQSLGIGIDCRLLVWQQIHERIVVAGQRFSQFGEPTVVGILGRQAFCFGTWQLAEQEFLQQFLVGFGKGGHSGSAPGEGTIAGHKSG